MLDLHYILEQEDLGRKIAFLNDIKLSIESIQFDRSAQNTSYSAMWHRNMNGNVNRLCRSILLILSDGFVLDEFRLYIQNRENSTISGSLVSLWSFLCFYFGDELLKIGDNECYNVALVEFQGILEQIMRPFQVGEQPVMERELDLTLDWIHTSLRHHQLYNQLKCMSHSSSRPTLAKFFKSNSFILDETFFKDFLIYIRAFEQDNISLLNETRHFKQSNSKPNSKNSSRLDLSILSEGQEEKMETDGGDLMTVANMKLLNLSENKKSKHRRIHSFPNIQINLLKKNTITLDEQSILVTPIQSTTQQTTINVPRLTLNGMSVDDDAPRKNYKMGTACMEEDAMKQPDEEEEDELERLASATTIFDFIHSVQINCESSQLDKENSHFVLADVAMSAAELINTHHLLQKSADQVYPITTTAANSRPMLSRMTSSAVMINNESVPSDNMRSFEDPSSQSSSFVQHMTPENNVPLRFRSSIVNHKANTLRPSLSLSNLSSANKSEESASSMDDGKGKLSKSKTSMDTIIVKEEEEDDDEKRAVRRQHWLMTNSKVNSNSCMFELSTEMEKENSKSKLSHLGDSVDTSRLSTSPMNSQNLSSQTYEESESSKVLSITPAHLTEDGFEIVNSRGKPSSMPRTRKFSWEESEEEDVDSAEYISNRLIRNLLLKKNLESSQIPNLSQFEFLIKRFQLVELIQMYHESLDLPKLKKNDSRLMLADVGQSRGVPLSSTSIYLSHGGGVATSSSSRRASLASSSTLVKSGMKKWTNNSTWSKVRQAAFDAIENKKSKLELFSSTTPAKSDFIDSMVNQQGSIRPTSLTGSKFVPGHSKKNSIGGGRIIGDSQWAPVREQLILHVPSGSQMSLGGSQRRSSRVDQMRFQQFRCADCGIDVDINKIKTFNYCEYFGKYFCRCCHINSKSYIPCYVVHQMDFRTTFEVCKKAKNFLENIYREPLITLESLNPQLFADPSSVFSKVKRLRYKLHNSRGYLNACRFAAELNHRLYSEFDDFIINDQHVYSIETLFKIKKTNTYVEKMRNLVNSVVIHIKTCELCSQQGHICGFCHNTNDLLYPFESERVEKCPNCLSCYHRACFRVPEECPRCVRMQKRLVSSSNLSELAK